MMFRTYSFRSSTIYRHVDFRIQNYQTIIRLYTISSQSWADKDTSISNADEGRSAFRSPTTPSSKRLQTVVTAWKNLASRFPRRSETQWKQWSSVVLEPLDQSSTAQVHQLHPKDFHEEVARMLSENVSPSVILQILSACTAAQINFLFSCCSTGTEGNSNLALRIIKHCRKAPFYGMLLSILTQQRIAEVSLVAKAVLLRAIHEQATQLKSMPVMRAICNIWLSTRNSDLILLKEAMQVSGGFKDLQSMIFRDIRSQELRNEILQHFAVEASQLSSQESTSSSLSICQPQHHLHIVTDLDDTIQLNWLDTRYPRGTVYPGALAFFRAIQRVSMKHKDSETSQFTDQVDNSSSNYSQLVEPGGSREQSTTGQSYKRDLEIEDILCPHWWNRHVSIHVNTSSTRSYKTMNVSFPVSPNRKLEDTTLQDSIPGLDSDSVASKSTSDLVDPDSQSDTDSAVDPLSDFLRDSELIELAAQSVLMSAPSFSPDGERDAQFWVSPRRSLAETKRRRFGRQLFGRLTSSTDENDRLEAEKEEFDESQQLSFKGDADSSDVLSPFVDTEDVTCTYGNIYVLTARPAGVRSIIKQHTVKKLASMGLGHVSVLSGSLRTATSSDGIAQRKLENLQQLMLMFPEYKFVLIGDAGQADTAVAAVALSYYSSRITAAFIHDISPDNPRTGDGGLKERYNNAGILFFNNYAQAAYLAANKGILDFDTAEVVAQQVNNELMELRPSFEAKGPRWRRKFNRLHRELVRDMQTFTHDHE